MRESFARTFKTLHAPCILILMNDPTNNDQLQTLVNALRQPGFRFILIQYNHLSIYDDVTKLLEEKYPEQARIELRISGNNYHSLTDQINEAGKAWIMIPDFDLLFTPEYEDVCTAFNQRRDFFARNNVVLICFILEGNMKQVPMKIPDFWSLRSLELVIKKESSPLMWDSFHVLLDIKEASSLGGKTPAEKEKEILRIKSQFDATETTNLVLKQELLSQLSQLYYDFSNHSLSLEYAQKAHQLSLKIGNKASEGAALNKIGQNYQLLGENHKALDALKQSLEIMHEIGDKSGVATTLNNMSQIYQLKEDYKKALECLEESLETFREIGIKAVEGTILNNIGNVYYAKSDYKKAINYLEESLKISQEYNEKLGESATLNNIAGIYQEKGDLDKAKKLLKLSLKYQHEIGDKFGLAGSLNNMGKIYLANGEFQKAKECLEQSLIIRRDIGDEAGLAFTLFNLATVYLDEKINEPEKAVTFFTECVEINKKFQNPQITEALKRMGFPSE